MPWKKEIMRRTKLSADRNNESKSHGQKRETGNLDKTRRSQKSPPMSISTWD